MAAAKDFQDLNLHDMRLIEVTARKPAGSDGIAPDEVRLLIQDDERSKLRPPRGIELTFHQVRGMRMVVDFQVKLMCNDAIMETFEMAATDRPELVDLFDDWDTSITSKVPSRDNLRLYSVRLIPESGMIEIVAQGVTIRDVPAVFLGSHGISRA